MLAAGTGQLLLYRVLPDTLPDDTTWQALLDSAIHADSPDQPAGACLDSIFSQGVDPLQSRAAAAHSDYPNPPLAGRLHSFAAASPVVPLPAK